MASDNSNLHMSFPDDFIFGTSVAAFQVEGNLSGDRKTDWDDFFNKNPDQIVRPGELGANWWGSFENIEKDLHEISKTGVKMQRLSIEWGRIEPEKGSVNKEALEYYRKIIDTCRKYNLNPLVTINHFTLPDWVTKEGGWTNSKTVDYVCDFASLLLSEFGEIEYWVIVNEPSNVVYLGNLLGIFPPNKKSFIATLKTRKNIILAQKKIYALIKKKLPNSKVGNAFSFLWLRSNDQNSKLEKFLAKSLNYLINTNYISATKDCMDFLGVNYYTGYYVDLKINYFSTTMRNEALYVPHHLPFGKTVRPKTYKTDMGWPIVPDFFLDVLKHVYKAYKKPIFITENGIADRDDIYRPFYILTHLVSVWKAMEEGIDIKGYIHWATIDNLEWLEGFAKRFGLIEVDPVSGQRKLRKGARVYDAIIKSGKIDVEKMIDEFVPLEQKDYARYVISQLLESKSDYCPRITKSVR